jgi:lipoyl-dependent peroxiredoxin
MGQGGCTRMAVTRRATAVWERDLLHGEGHVTGDSGALPRLPVTWAARTEAPGGKTSPEELLAAAHAACFAMAFSGQLARRNKPPERLSVSAVATFDKLESGWKVTQMHLEVEAKVAGIAPADFEAARDAAEKGCPISNAIRGNVDIQVSAKLV